MVIRGTRVSVSSEKCGSKSRCVVSKPSKGSSAHARTGARSAERGQGDTQAAASGGTRRKASRSRTKAQLEQDVAELKRINAELEDELRRERERARQLEQINQQAGERIDSVIGRIKTLLAS